MSGDDIFSKHLRTLAERETWRVRELPPEITEGVLRVHDERRWVQFRLWERQGSRIQPNTYCGWFSPRWQPHVAGNLEFVLNRRKDDAELSPEVRVSEAGKAELAVLAVCEASPPSAAPGAAAVTGAPADATNATEFDIFVCHASEDKGGVVVPLTNELIKRGLRVWVDYRELRLGDKLRERIDDGLRRSRFGIVIVSPRFFAKQWPQIELDGLVALETADRRKRILPIWHEVEQPDVTKHSPTLAGRLAARWAGGVSQVADEVIRAIGD
jgi:hypothetical protein